MNIAPEQWQDTDLTECRICGDTCGEEICYSCETTAEDMGVDIYDLVW